MIFNLSKERYALLKTIDFSEIKNSIVFFDTDCKVKISDADRYGNFSALRLFQVIISEEIDRNGLTDDQNDVTPYGRRLYDLYDCIYAQI